MSELALLGTRYTTDGAAQALQTLDQYAAKAKGATEASDAVAGGSKRMSASMQQMVESISRAEREMAEVTQYERAMAQAADAAAASTRALGLAVGQASPALSKASRDAQSAAVSFQGFYDAAQRNFATAYVQQMNSVVAVHGRAAGSSKVLTQTGLNLSRQFADIGVTAAMGMNPLMIFIQQAPQVIDAFAQAKTQGLNFKDALSGVAKGAGALVLAWGPLIAVGGAVVGAFMLYRKHAEDVKAATDRMAAATKRAADGQQSILSAYSSAADFAEKYEVSSKSLTKAIDGVILSQNAAYGETMRGIGAMDAAGQAAMRRAEMERLATIAILKRAAAESDDRAKKSDEDAKGARKTAHSAGFWSGMGSAWAGAEFPAASDPIAIGAEVEAKRYRELGGETAEKAAASERKYGSAVKASIEEMARWKLVTPEAQKARDAAAKAAERDGNKTAEAAKRAREATAEYIKTLEQQLQSVGQTSEAVRRLAADREIELALQRGDVESAARIKGLILETEKMEDLAKALEEATEWRKKALDAANSTGALTQAPTNIVFDKPDEIGEMAAAFEDAARKAADVRYAVDDIFYGIREKNWAGAFAGLFNVIKQLQAAFDATATKSQRLGAVGGVLAGVGGQVGGTAGSVIGSVGSGFSAAGAAAGMAGSFGAFGTAIAGLAGPIGIAVAGFSLLGSVLGKDKAKERAKNEEAQRRAQDEIARVTAIANQRRDLEIELMEAQGNAAGALAARRKAELAAMDAGNRALQELVWAEQKLAEERQKAVDAAQQAVDDARGRLSEAYNVEERALQEYIDRFKGWSESLNKFLKSLYSGPSAMLSPEEQYRAARSAFDSTSAAAAGGDENAIRDLESVSQAYLDASKDYYASSKEYFADLDRVRSAVSATQGYAAQQVDVGQAQLTALNASVAGILNINSSVLSVRDALAGYQAAVLALASAQAAQAANDNAVGGGGAKAADWGSYISTNSDVAAEYLRNQNSSKGRDYLAQMGIGSVTDFGRWHYENYGKAEGRTPFATGGSFTVGGSGGTDSQDFGPIALTPGEVVNVRRPGDMAKDGAEEKALLRAQIEKLGEIINELQVDKAQRASMAEEQEKQNERLEAEMARLSRTMAARAA